MAFSSQWNWPTYLTRTARPTKTTLVFVVSKGWAERSGNSTWAKLSNNFAMPCKPRMSSWVVATSRNSNSYPWVPGRAITPMHSQEVFGCGRESRMRELELLPETDVKTKTVKNSAPHRKGDPCVMVIFGGAGDLTKRKLIPALCNLAEQGFLPQQFAIIAVTYTDLTTDTFRQQVSDDIKTFALRPVDPAICKRLVEHTYYVRGDFADPGTYDRLKATLDEVATKEN